MTNNQPITIIGAGISGLATAYYQVKANRQVRIIERTAKAGGLVGTIRTEHGPVERAASSIRNSARFEALCEEIGVPLLAPRDESRARYIFRDRPRQWPLTAGETLGMVGRLLANLAHPGPKPFESIGDWGRRVLGKGATGYLLSPALSGIYSADPEQLSASLIFRRSPLAAPSTEKAQRPKVRGIVAPEGGMQQLIDGLTEYLREAGVEFQYEQELPIEPDEPTIVCTSAREAAALLESTAPEVGRQLARIEMIPLLTATCFYSPQAARLEGFGCLFPRDQGVRPLGVLFNSCTFDQRGPHHSETWIFGGALDREAIDLPEAEIREAIAQARYRLLGEKADPLGVYLTRWPDALPHYTVELERVLKSLPPLPPNLRLVGNYLGKIGLAGIVERAAVVEFIS